MVPLPVPHLLLIEDDSSTAEILTFLFQEEGYRITTVSSLSEAMTSLQNTPFDLILTDLFGRTNEEAWASAVPLVERASPTPVAVLTARRCQPEQDISAFAFVCEKPPDIEDLLGWIAITLHPALDNETNAEAALLSRYYALLNQPDCWTAADLCSADVVYLPPPRATAREPLIGRESLREFLMTTAPQYPERLFDQLRVYPLPASESHVVRYRVSWRLATGQPASFRGAGVYTIRNGLIQQIGVSRISPTMSTLDAGVFPTNTPTS